MSSFLNVAKGGWHPKNDVAISRKSFTKDGLKNGFMGKHNKQEEKYDPDSHHAAPLATLKDPSLFAPPPKHINYHGAAAVPNATTPDRRGWGAPLPQSMIEQQQQAAVAQKEEEEKPKSPPVPYRVNTTGLRTDALPTPPVRRIEAEPEEMSAGVGPSRPMASRTPQPQAARPVPAPPPRLPPRQNSHPDQYAPEPPPAYSIESKIPPATSYINHAAASRLGQAGISVPGLGIGSSSAVRELTSSDFSATVFAGTPVLVDFYAPYCRYCKELDPVYERLAESLTGQPVIIAKVDAHKYADLKAQYSIEMFPTIKWFNGKNNKYEDYESSRDLEYLQSFVQSKLGAGELSNNSRVASPVSSQQFSTQKAAMPSFAQVNELQSRFARLTSPSHSSEQVPTRASTSTSTWQQKQKAVEQLASSASPLGKKAPPPPPKKKNLGALSQIPQQQNPPPVPMGSKPR